MVGIVYRAGSAELAMLKFSLASCYTVVILAAVEANADSMDRDCLGDSRAHPCCGKRQGDSVSGQKPRKIILSPPRLVLSIVPETNRLSSKRQEAQMHVMSGEKTHLSKMKLI